MDTDKRYRTLYADPPWNERGGGRIKRGADRHYSLMKTEEIIAIQDTIAELADENCHLWLWVTNNFLQDGLRVMKAWGFRYITNSVWVKDRFGLGQYLRGQHELCLFGVKGRLPYRNKGVTTVLHEDGIRIHSQKPKGMYAKIEKVSYPPRIELFARDKRPGWDSIGYDIDGFMFIEENEVKE